MPVCALLPLYNFAIDSLEESHRTFTRLARYACARLWRRFFRSAPCGLKHRNQAEIFKHTHRDIYIYICCEVIIWAKFGHFRCYYLGQVGVIIWAKLFLAYKNSGFKRFLAHTVIILCFFCAQLSGSYLKIAFFKKGCKNWVFSIFCVLSLKFENSLF